MANKNMRTVKIYGMSGYKYQATPTIMLKGKWLEELGFEIGDYITVSCEDGKLIITPDTERAALAKAEQEFMEREMASLNKRFQKEKERFAMCPLLFAYRMKKALPMKHEDSRERLLLYVKVGIIYHPNALTFRPISIKIGRKKKALDERSLP